MKKYLTLWVFIQLLRCLPMAAQCAEIEEVLKDIVTKEINPNVISKDYDTYKRIACYTLGEMKEDDFVLLGRGVEYSNILQNDPSTVEYKVLRMVNKSNGVACEYIFIKKKKDTVNYRNFTQFQRQRISNLIKAKEENLALLKNQQAYLNTDILNILGDVLVGEIDAPEPFSEIVSDAAKKLKNKGIDQVAKYYELEYVPSENETANFVRKIIDPIDNFLGKSGIPTGKWLKYWEALKLTPDGGMVLGNAAAKIRIYFMEKDLREDIENLNKRLAEIPDDDVPSNAYSETSEEQIHLKSSW